MAVMPRSSDVTGKMPGPPPVAQEFSWLSPLIDPRAGDVEDDAASTKSQSLLVIGGRLLAEISLPKLLVAWIMLIGLPAILLGLAPLVLLGLAGTMAQKFTSLLIGAWSLLILIGLIVLAWFIGRPLLRQAEQGFWSLNALAVQPVYALVREGLRHIAGRIMSGAGPLRLRRLYAAAALGGGILVSAASPALNRASGRVPW